MAPYHFTNNFTRKKASSNMAPFCSPKESLIIVAKHKFSIPCPACQGYKRTEGRSMSHGKHEKIYKLSGLAAALSRRNYIIDRRLLQYSLVFDTVGHYMMTVFKLAL